MTHSPANDAAHFELRVSPDVTVVATVRRFVGDLCARIFTDPDVISRVIVATHELLDNAARYALADTCWVRVEVQRAGDEAGVVIVTENRVNEERRRELAEVIDELTASVSRESYYQDVLRRVANRPEEGGLGLARVHAESELCLSSTLHGDVVQVRAAGRFSLSTGAALR